MPKAPEQEARARIDAQLAACGWAVQDFKNADFSASCGIALREVRLKSGRCDSLLLVDRKPVGVVEAKKEGTTRSIIADQATSYADDLSAAELAQALGGRTPARDVVYNPAVPIEPEDSSYAPFDQRGGLGKAHQLFGAELPSLLDERNEALAA